MEAVFGLACLEARRIGFSRRSIKPKQIFNVVMLEEWDGPAKKRMEVLPTLELPNVSGFTLSSRAIFHKDVKAPVVNENKASNVGYGAKLWEALGAIRNSSYTAKVLQSTATLANGKGTQYIIMTGKKLSNSCRAGIWDLNANKWVMRLDMPHGKMKHAHINLNYVLTGVRDPHFKIPKSLVKSCDIATQTAQLAGNLVILVAVGNDMYRVVKAYSDDYQVSGSMVPGKKTAETAACVASGWTGAFFGAAGGGLISAKIGAIALAPFGAVISVPGAAVLSLVGTVYGAYWGCNKAVAYVESFSQE